MGSFVSGSVSGSAFSPHSSVREGSWEGSDSSLMGVSDGFQPGVVGGLGGRLSE